MINKLRVAGNGHLFNAKDIWTLTFPLIIEQLLSITIGMADTIMVSGYAESAVSAVSSVDILSQLFIQVFAAFATGGAVIVSQYLGHKEKENAEKAARNLLYVATTISLILLFFCLIFRNTIINLVLGKAESEVQKSALSYFIPIMISFPFLAVFDGATAISRSTRKTTRTMVVALFMNIVNIGGNYLLIYVADLGAAGAGIASMLSRVFGALFMFILMCRKDEEVSFRGILKGPVSKDLILKISKIGLPSALDGSLFHIGKIMVQTFIAGVGTSALAINAVVGNYNAYSNIIGNAINLAIITLVGYAAGAGRKDEERYYARLMMTLCIGATLLLTLPMYIFTDKVVAIYSLSPENTAKAIPICRLCLVMCTLIWPFSFTLPNALNATGDVKYTMTTSIISMWTFRVFLSYVLICLAGFGVEAAWYGMYADWSFRSIMFLIRYKGKKWQDSKVI